MSEPTNDRGETSREELERILRVGNMLAGGAVHVLLEASDDLRSSSHTNKKAEVPDGETSAEGERG